MKCIVPKSFLSIALFIFIFGFAYIPSVLSQTCQNPPTQILASSFPQNSIVNFYIEPTFTTNQKNIIRLELALWSGVGLANVNFYEVFDIGDLGNPFVNGANPIMQFIRATPNPSTSQGTTSGQAFLGCRATAFITINPGVTNETAFSHVVSHELGHAFALADCTTCAQGSTSMTLPQSPNLNEAGGHSGPTSCDISQMRACLRQSPTPTPTPTPTPILGFCNGTTDFGQYPSSGCAMGFVNSGGTCTRSSSFISQCNRFGGYDFDSCGCSGSCSEDGSCSPVVIDVSGNGFSLTDVLNGVDFDLDGNGVAERWSWTSVDSDDAWLALDRNGNGVIDGGRELFGSVTSQPPPPEGVELNGFNALAEYDTAGFGGNGDGQITAQDAIFDRLRLWQDTNHNGISEANELQTLSALGVRKIDLDYKPSRRTDRYGNRFKYRTKVRDVNGAQLGRWAWDVFLLNEQ